MAKKTVLLLPALGAGHLTPSLEAAKRLLRHLNAGSAGADGEFSITVLLLQASAPDVAAAVEARVEESGVAAGAGNDNGITVVRCLPPIDGPADAECLEDLVSRVFQLAAPRVRDAIDGSPVPVAAVVVDFLATAVLDVAAERGVPAYVLFTSPAALLALMLHLPSIRDDQPDGEPDHMAVPGMASPVPRACFPAAAASKKGRGYEWYVYHGKRFSRAKGIIVNTAADVEPGVLAALSNSTATPPVYPVGPLVGPTAPPSGHAHPCIEWLDTQPPASVVFLCFGSLGCFDRPQTLEIAAGLERSGSRFLWALRVPPAAGRVHPSDADLGEALPEGFLERTAGRGLVWPSWAPQRAVLSHPAVGGFVSHCGAASCLETLWAGVPVVAWPLYSEQYFHAHWMASEVGVAAAALGGTGGPVAAAEVERAVRRLMDEDSEDGRRARARAAEMKTACRTAVGDGGSSDDALRRLCDCIRRMHSTRMPARSEVVKPVNVQNPRIGTND
ncbi:hypothetical protein ACP70R_009695 [Stipagrostis hirtigluma subsp. patula]